MTRQDSDDPIPDDSFYVEVAFDALDELEYRWQQYVEAKTVGSQAGAFVELSNAMSDVISYHPNWDYERGEVRRDEE